MSYTNGLSTLHTHTLSYLTVLKIFLHFLNVLIRRYPPFYNLKVQSARLNDWTSLTFCITPSPLTLLSPPPGGLSAGQPNSQLPGAAVRPPPPAPPVGRHLPGPHLAELRPGALVWCSGQRPWEALHPAVRPHPRGERLIVQVHEKVQRDVFASLCTLQKGQLIKP